MQYKHQILKEINRTEVGFARRSLQKKRKVCFKRKGSVLQGQHQSKVPVSQPPFSQSPGVMTSLTDTISRLWLWVPGDRNCPVTGIHCVQPKKCSCLSWIVEWCLGGSCSYTGELHVSAGELQSMHRDPGRAVSTCSWKATPAGLKPPGIRNNQPSCTDTHFQSKTQIH